MESLINSLHRLLRIFGYWPFTILRCNNGISIRITLFDGLWLITCLGVYLICSCIQLKAFSVMTYTNSPALETTMNFISMMGDQFISISNILLDVCNRHAIGNMLFLFTEVDATVCIIQCSKKLQRSFNVLLLSSWQNLDKDSITNNIAAILS